MNAWDVSTRLLQLQGRSLERHTVLRENLATYLTQLKPEFLDSLEQVPEDTWVRSLTCAYAHGPVDMVQKLSRDLAQMPYSDEAVLQRLDRLEGELKSKLEETVEGSGSYPCRFFITGSLLKGRFGANSDLDLLCQASPEWSRAHYRHAFEDVSVQYFHQHQEPERGRYLASFAPTLEISPQDLEQPGFLRRLYEEGVAKRGYRVEAGHLVAQGPIVREREVPPSGGSINWSAPQMV